jgi:hypothetical protein
MNWRLILQLSLLALGMGVASVFLIPPTIEPLFWLLIFAFCAYVLARNTTRPFLHGLFLGLANCVWIIAAHVIFFDRYVAGHPAEAGMLKSMPAPDWPRLMMVLFGIPFGIVSGCVIGLFAWIASKFVKPNPTIAGDPIRH